MLRIGIVFHQYTTTRRKRRDQGKSKENPFKETHKYLRTAKKETTTDTSEGG
jgi:hypothetical protein